jgi:cation:H+ antiporter
MSLISHLLIFAVSVAVLVKSADWLVEFGARVARRLGVSDLVIGLTLTSVGTSVPELASSVSAALQDNSGLIIGNVVGSNIANIGLIAGVASLIKPFDTESKMYDRDGFILLAASVLFFVLILDNSIGRVEAVSMAVVYVAYMGFLGRSDQDKVAHQFRYFLGYIVNLDMVRPMVRRLRHPRRSGKKKQIDLKAEPAAGKLYREILAIIGSCAGVVVGARYMVQEATWAARMLGVPDSVIGLSLVAVGTSLPELIVAITAARKGNAGMVIGNVMGSNLANILLIIGVSGTISPIKVAEMSVVYTVPIMLFFTLGLLHFVRSGWRVTRWQGAIALGGYALFMVLAFMQGWS